MTLSGTEGRIGDERGSNGIIGHFSAIGSQRGSNMQSQENDWWWPSQEMRWLGSRPDGGWDQEERTGCSWDGTLLRLLSSNLPYILSSTDMHSFDLCSASYL
ncbi:hypothetical protein ACMYSQ_002376 [Aspergillus niger]